MRCPNCGSEVDEGALTCPHCQIDLSLTQRIPVTQAHWCPHCGALVPAAAESCPKCGLPLPQAVPAARPARAIRPTRNINLPEIDAAPAPGEKTDPLADADFDASSSVAADPTVLQHMPADNADPDATSAFASVSRRPAPRFESAIPSEPSKENLPEAEGIPRTRVILLSALLVTSLVVAAIFVITHPWDPQATDNRAKVEAPVSSTPTTTPVTHLTGQDTVQLSKIQVRMLFLTHLIVIIRSLETSQSVLMITRKPLISLLLLALIRNVLMLNRKQSRFRWILVMLSLTFLVLMTPMETIVRLLKISPSWATGFVIAPML